MLVEIIIALILGILFGTFSGLAPGIHINLVSLLLLTISPFLLTFTSPIVLAAFIVSMGVTHTFLDAVPSIFLGAPDEAQALNVLPGHKLLLEGRGYEAVKLSVIGALISLIAVILITPILIPIIVPFYEFIQPYIGYILIFVVGYMTLSEKTIKEKLWALAIFLLSGVLGLLVFNIPNLNQPLFPLLSGLFGVSTLVLSLNEKVKIPEQSFTKTVFIETKNKVKAVFAAVFTGSLAGLFPGLGPAQVATIGMNIVGDIGEYAYMILVGGIGTVNFVFSLVALYTIEKARNGAIVVVLEMIKSIDLTQLVVLLMISLAAGCIAAYLSLKVSKVFAKYIVKVNYQKLCMSIIILIAVMALIFGNFIGFLILIVSTCIGLLAPLVNVKRSSAMGCLLLPVILYFII